MTGSRKNRTGQDAHRKPGFVEKRTVEPNVQFASESQRHQNPYHRPNPGGDSADKTFRVNIPEDDMAASKKSLKTWLSILGGRKK